MRSVKRVGEGKLNFKVPPPASKSACLSEEGGRGVFLESPCSYKKFFSEATFLLISAQMPRRKGWKYSGKINQERNEEEDNSQDKFLPVQEITTKFKKTDRSKRKTNIHVVSKD